MQSRLRNGLGEARIEMEGEQGSAFLPAKRGVKKRVPRQVEPSRRRRRGEKGSSEKCKRKGKKRKNWDRVRVSTAMGKKKRVLTMFPGAYQHERRLCSAKGGEESRITKGGGGKKNTQRKGRVLSATARSKKGEFLWKRKGKKGGGVFLHLLAGTREKEGKETNTLGQPHGEKGREKESDYTIRWIEKL